jgi:NAD(P)-dependent dehydrogenase (short-subunit alcohol dehydrogenase family)
VSIPTFSLAGERVVVIGTASGMGQAAARLLTKDGAGVHAVDVTPTSVPVAQSYEVDLGDSRAFRELAASIDGPVAAPPAEARACTPPRTR